MDLFSYASGKVSGIIGDSPSPMHYREHCHRGIPRYPRASGITGDNSPDMLPFPGASVGDSLKNETVTDPAKNFPNKASLDAGWAEYNGRWEAWEAAGKAGEEPHPPAGLLSAMGSRLIPRSKRGASQWRK
jgi:hypothetical protein